MDCIYNHITGARSHSQAGAVCVRYHRRPHRLHRPPSSVVVPVAVAYGPVAGSGVGRRVAPPLKDERGRGECRWRPPRRGGALPLAGQRRHGHWPLTDDQFISFLSSFAGVDITRANARHRRR